MHQTKSAVTDHTISLNQFTDWDHAKMIHRPDGPVDQAINTHQKQTRQVNKK